MAQTLLLNIKNSKKIQIKYKQPTYQDNPGMEHSKQFLLNDTTLMQSVNPNNVVNIEIIHLHSNNPCYIQNVYPHEMHQLPWL